MLTPGRLRHAAQRRRVTAEPFAGAVDDGRATRVAEPGDLLDGQRLIVEQSIAAVLPQQVDEQVLVGQGRPQVRGRHRPTDGHHVHDAASRRGGVDQLLLGTASVSSVLGAEPRDPR